MDLSQTFELLSEFFAQITPEIVSLIISGASLLLATIVAYLNHKNGKRANENEKKIRALYEEKEENRKKDQEKYRLIKLNEGKAELIPYFHIDLEDKIKVDGEEKDKRIVLPISLINLGREAATNVRIVPEKENVGLSGYITSVLSSGVTYYIHDYLNKQFAFPGGVVKFAGVCNYHDQGDEVHFMIHFNDLVGRTYKQEFKFQYSIKHGDSFSQNHYSSTPECINDKNKNEIESLK